MGDEPVTALRRITYQPSGLTAVRSRYRSTVRQLRTPAGAVLVAGALGQLMTAPGQTAALSVFIDPIIASLGVSRSGVSTAYLVATLVGACALPLVGRGIDRFGVRAAMAAVGVAFGAALFGAAAVVGLVTLLLAFAGLRMLGQGSLQLTSTTAVALAFDRRRGTALAISTAVGAAGISLAPVGLNQVIDMVGWRWAFAVEGAAVLVVVPAVAVFGLGLHPRMKARTQRRSAGPAESAEGDERPRPQPQPSKARAPATNPISWTPRQAMRAPMFWAMTGALGAFSMIGTSLNFHQISLLGEYGLSRAEAAAIFLPQTASVLLCTLAAGPLIDRLPPRLLLTSTMLALAGAMLLVTVAAPGWRAIIYGVVLGSGMGSLRTMESAITPRYFGVGHLGSLRGILTAVSVGSSAFGPILLAAGQESFGSYTPVIMALLAVPAAVALALLLAPTPTGAPKPPGSVR